MSQILKQIEKKIIVSCQASSNEPLYEECCMLAMIKSIITGGAKGLRLAGIRDISNAKKITDLPIIGITKPDPIPNNFKEIVYITPTCDDVRKIITAGADIIAFDGTSRTRPKENLAEIISFIRSQNKLAMADVATIEEGIAARLLGADIISTTLSGYTKETQEKDPKKPDFKLLESLKKALNCPIILEGRVWTDEHLKTAFEKGAHCVVIGSAITRPQLITQKFVKAAQKIEGA